MRWIAQVSGLVRQVFNIAGGGRLVFQSANKLNYLKKFMINGEVAQLVRGG